MTESESSETNGKATARKRQHSKELLQPPKGPGVSFLQKELQKEKTKVKVPVRPPQTFKVEESSVLSLVKSFLPDLQQADSDLKERLQSEPAEKLDIENLTEGEPCIEIDLAVVPLPLSDSEDSSSSSSSSSGDSQHDQRRSRFPLKLNKRRKRRRKDLIEELGER